MENKGNIRTKNQQQKVKIKGKVLWIGGGIVVLASGAAFWYLRQKKKKQSTFPKTTATKLTSTPRGRPTGRFSCNSSSYPLNFGTCSEEVKVLQRYLKSRGMNLGKSGKTRDGVDGQFGALTQAAALKVTGKSSFSQSDITGFKNALKFVG